MGAITRLLGKRSPHFTGADLMPAMLYDLRWPDGQITGCYSPSLVIADFVVPGNAYPLPDLIARLREAYAIANERVRAKFGFTCSQAAAQLAEIEARAAHFAADPEASVMVLSFRDAP